MTLWALRQAIWWLAYATSIPNSMSDLISEGVGWRRYVTCISLKTVYLIKVSSKYQIYLPAIFSFFTLPDNLFFPDGEMLLDLICNAHSFYYTHNTYEVRVRMSVKRTYYIF